MTMQKSTHRLITLSKVRNSNSDLYSKIRDFLIESNTIYPSIEEWWMNRVLPGLKNRERVCQLIMAKDQIAALSIIKNSSKSSKLCTLRVREEYRSSGFGQSLLRFAFERFLSNKCESVHYTISDEMMVECGDFFTPYGFKLSSWNRNRYVKGKDELVFSVPTPRLINSMVAWKFDKASEPRALLLSIKPENADLIEKGLKQVEFRRRFSSNWSSIPVFFYVTSPVKEIRFTARIKKIVKSDPSSLWSQFQKEGGIKHGAFSSYFEHAPQGTAVVLTDIQSLEQPIRLDDLRMLAGGFVPPQSYRVVRRDEPLFNLVADQESDKTGF